MKNLFSSIIKETVHGKSTKLKNRAMLMKHINEDLANQDYNPKTARHKSLKEISLPGFKLDWLNVKSAYPKEILNRAMRWVGAKGPILRKV